MDMKVSKSPRTALYPVPVVLVTSGLEGYQPDIITIAWTGTINSEPPTVYVRVNTSRHSHKSIKESGQYVINIPSAEQAKEKGSVAKLLFQVVSDAPFLLKK